MEPSTVRFYQDVVRGGTETSYAFGNSVADEIRNDAERQRRKAFVIKAAMTPQQTQTFLALLGQLPYKNLSTEFSSHPVLHNY